MIHLRVIQITFITANVTHLVEQSTEILDDVDLTISAFEADQTQHRHVLELTGVPKFYLLMNHF